MYQESVLRYEQEPTWNDVTAITHHVAVFLSTRSNSEHYVRNHTPERIQNRGERVLPAPRLLSSLRRPITSPIIIHHPSPTSKVLFGDTRLLSSHQFLFHSHIFHYISLIFLHEKFNHINNTWMFVNLLDSGLGLDVCISLWSGQEQY